jgi:23S rRNA (guanine745-N1)-methyltransferase
MLDGIVRHLRCPVCGAGLAAARAAGAALRCPSGHSFDLARQGYVDLTAGRVTHAGDSADMLAARASLLDAGHFRPLADAVVAAVSASPRGLVVDVGAGTGYYLAAVLDARPGDVGLALDVAKPALRRAAGAHPRLNAVRADVWRGLPVADGAASVVLDVFAPRSGPEFRRVLRPDGLLVVATPTRDHLAELRGPVTVDPDKNRRLAATLDPWFHRIGRQLHRWPLRLTADEAAALVTMGPSARHADPATFISGPVTVSAVVQVTSWRPRRP